MATLSFSLHILRRIAETTSVGTLDRAIDANDICLVWLLIENCAMMNDAVFGHACRKGQTEIVRMLLDLPLAHGVHPAANNSYALRTASERGHTEIVRLLLDLPLAHGVHPAANNNYALRSACAQEHIEIVRLLLDLPLERGVNPSAALRLASFYGYKDIVQMIIDLPQERGVVVDKHDIRFARGNGHTEIVRMLKAKIP